MSNLEVLWVILLDHSGSMGERLGRLSSFQGYVEKARQGIKLDAAKDVLEREIRSSSLVDDIKDIAVIAFTGKARLLFISQRASAIQHLNQIHALQPENGTDIAEALNFAHTQMTKWQDYDLVRFLMISDGLSEVNPAKKAAEACRTDGIYIDMILINDSPEGLEMARAILVGGRITVVTSGMEDLETAVENTKREFGLDIQQASAQTIDWKQISNTITVFAIIFLVINALGILVSGNLRQADDALKEIYDAASRPLASPTILSSPTLASPTEIAVNVINASGQEIGDGTLKVTAPTEITYPETAIIKLDLELHRLQPPIISIITPVATAPSPTPPLEGDFVEIPHVYELMGASLLCLESSFEGCDTENDTDKVRTIDEDGQNWTWIISPKPEASSLQHLRIEIWTLEIINSNLPKANPIGNGIPLEISVIQRSEEREEKGTDTAIKVAVLGLISAIAVAVITQIGSFILEHRKQKATGGRLPSKRRNPKKRRTRRSK